MITVTLTLILLAVLQFIFNVPLLFCGIIALVVGGVYHYLACRKSGKGKPRKNFLDDIDIDIDL